MRCQADLRAARGEIERLNNVVRQVILMSPPISLTLRAVPDVMRCKQTRALSPYLSTSARETHYAHDDKAQKQIDTGTGN